MRIEIYDRLHREVVKRMDELPDILKCGDLEICLDRYAWEAAVSDQLARMWEGKGAPPKKWIADNFEDAILEVCQSQWVPG